MGEILDSLQAEYDREHAAEIQAQQQLAAVHQQAVGSFVNQNGSNLGTYGFMGSAGYDPYQSNSLRPDQSNAERIDQQVGNFQYGGYAGGATDAQAAAREAVDSQAYNLGQYGSQFIGQSAAGAAGYGMGMGGLYGTAGQLNDYAQQGPGPSVAQAQLAANTAAQQRFALSMAGSGRGPGGGAAAMRQAQAQNAVTQGQANAQTAMLQAQEAQNWRQAQLGAMQAAGGLYGQGAGLGGQYATGMGGLAADAQASSGNLALGGEQLSHQIGATALAGSQGYEQNLTDIYGINRGTRGPSDPGINWADLILTTGGAVAGGFAGGPAGAVAGAGVGHGVGSNFG